MAVWYFIIWTGCNLFNESPSDGYLDFQSSAIFKPCPMKSSCTRFTSHILEHICRIQTAAHRSSCFSGVITSAPLSKLPGLGEGGHWPPGHSLGCTYSCRKFPKTFIHRHTGVIFEWVNEKYLDFREIAVSSRHRKETCQFYRLSGNNFKDWVLIVFEVNTFHKSPWIRPLVVGEKSGWRSFSVL